MATTIINVSKRRRLIPLEHPAFYKKRWGFQRRVVRTYAHNPKTGARGLLEQRKATPGVLTLLAGAKMVDLPDAIAAVPAVKSLKAKGYIILRESTADELKKAKVDRKKMLDKLGVQPKRASSEGSPPPAKAKNGNVNVNGNGKRGK